MLKIACADMNHLESSRVNGTARFAGGFSWVRCLVQRVYKNVVVTVELSERSLERTRLQYVLGDYQFLCESFSCKRDYESVSTLRFNDLTRLELTTRRMYKKRLMKSRYKDRAPKIYSSGDRRFMILYLWSNTD